MYKFLDNAQYTLQMLQNAEAKLSPVTAAPPAFLPPRPRPSQLAQGGVVHTGISKHAQTNVIFTQPAFYSPLHTPQNWQTPSKRREVYQYCRHFVDNEPKVAAALDFYSHFPMNGFTIQHKNFQIKRYFEYRAKKLRLPWWCKLISRDYYTLGDVIPFCEIDCPECHGSGYNREGICTHPGGNFRRIVVLNPDTIEVMTSQMAEDPVITLIPDDELKRLVWLKQPKQFYDKIPDHIKKLILAGRPIPLANESVSHIKFNPYPYGVYGTSLLRRLFKVLMYKDKLMTAQWIVAERLILPIRVVKVGDDNRPANATDIADVQAQLAQVANDPNLTLVTHHAFDYDWIGTNGKVLQLSNEYDLINKEILQGLMLNEALLSGEMAGYSSAAIGAEALLQRMESWRLELAQWIEERVFTPIAQMQGLINEELTNELGEPVWDIPTIKWNDMHLRDETQIKQTYMQLHDKQVMSTQTLCEKMDLNYDQEVDRIRYESAQGIGQPQQQGGAQGQDGGMPMGGGGMGAPGGGGGMEVGGAMPLGGAPGAGGDMGGGLGAPMGAPGGMAAAAGAGPMGGSAGKVLSSGRKGKAEGPTEQDVVPQHVKLTSIEIAMRKALEGMQLPFKKFIQPKIGKYSADFTIPALQLDIECDGGIWHENPEAQAHDQKRDAELANYGWTVIRFSEKEIKERMADVQNTLTSVVQNLWQKAWEKSQKQEKKASHQHDLNAYRDVPLVMGYTVNKTGYEFGEAAWTRVKFLGKQALAAIGMETGMMKCAYAEEEDLLSLASTEEGSDGEADQGQGNTLG
jgi:very-short-patch-repair endonuclease